MANYDEVFDDICEHSFLGRLSDLGIVGMHFATRAEVEQYEDAYYVLSVQHHATLLDRRLRSLQRLLQTLSKEIRLDSFPFNPAGFIEISEDAMYMRLTSLSDILMQIVNEVFELGIETRECSLGNISKALNQKEILPSLGKLSNPKRKMRQERHARFHSGLETSHDKFDQGFELASLFRDRGHGLIIPDGEGEISLQSLFESRLKALILSLRSELDYSFPLLVELFDELEPEFEIRFKQKCRSENSFMALQRQRRV